MKLNATTFGQFHQRIRNVPHSFLGQKGANSVLQMGNHRQYTRCLVGRGSVVGSKTVEQLAHFLRFEGALVYLRHGAGQVQFRQSPDGRFYVLPSVGFQSM